MLDLNPQGVKKSGNLKSNPIKAILLLFYAI
jgi:hypothetical protein